MKDVSYAFTFGSIDCLAQNAQMGDTDSVAKVTLLFLAKHLGIEQNAAIEQMQGMMGFSESAAGLEIMKQGGTAINQFLNEDMSSISVLSGLLKGDYFTSS